VRQHLAPWARDALGIGLVVLGLLAVLGLWFDAAGPVGRGIDWMLHATFGVVAVVFPVVALYWGVLLLRGTAEQDRLRMFIGFAVAFVGVLALISLSRGNPKPFSGYLKVGDAAGFVGALASWPLGKLVSKIGVAIVWSGATVL
jgi:S-DNA-T family DNA segregation ATPase FtsK/SpoIIIE